jgi:hypothetical protein
MPSSLPAFTAGFEPLISGVSPSPAGARAYGGIIFQVDKAASGNVYIGGPGATINSGGDMSSSGQTDGFAIPPGGQFNMPVPVGGLSAIWVNVTVATSGQCRMWWQPY